MSAWLLKSEPSTYSIDDLKNDKKTYWDGVRNYQARNFLRDSLKVGDSILFYHSNAEPSGVTGVAKVCKAGYPEKKDPTWFGVDVEFVSKFKRLVSLEEIKSRADLKGIMVAQKGSRLSVQPVSDAHFKIIEKLGQS